MQSTIEYLKGYFSTKDVTKVLDIGTGRGNYMGVLTEIFGDQKEFYGIDMSLDALEIAKKHFDNDHYHFLEMNAENINFDDATFDVIALSNSLHHLPNYDKVLSEVKRLLKPEGIFLMNEMVCDGLSERQMTHTWIHHFSADIDKALGRFHDYTYSQEKLTNIIKENGFDIFEFMVHSTHEDQVPHANLEEEQTLLENTFTSLEKHIMKLEKPDQRKEFQNRLTNKKDDLMKVGFFSATGITLIAKPQ